MAQRLLPNQRNKFILSEQTHGIGTLIKDVPLDSLGHYQNPNKQNRRHAKYLEVQKFTEEFFRRTKKGIKFSHLIEAGLAKNKKDAQSKVKRYVRAGCLFTWEDKKPQEYFPTSIKPEVIAYLLAKNVPIEPSGVNPKIKELLEEVRHQSLEWVLAQLPDSPLGIHNLHLLFSTIPEYYDDLSSTPSKRNRGKRFQQPIGPAVVTCIVYPNGTVDVQIECNKNPFSLESEGDVSNLVAFLGEVKAFVSGILSDPRGRVIPDVRDWILTECDINKDIAVGDAFSLVSLHTQGNFRVRDFEYVLRVYFKVLRSKTVLRTEVSLAPRIRIGEVLTIFLALAIALRRLGDVR